MTLTAYIFFLSQSNSEICFNELSSVPGLNPVMPSGAMYLMVSTMAAGIHETVIAGKKDTPELHYKSEKYLSPWLINNFSLNTSGFLSNGLIN